MPSTSSLKYEDVLDFVKFCTGEAATMTAIAEEISALNCWSALEARTSSRPQICTEGGFLRFEME